MTAIALKSKTPRSAIAAYADALGNAVLRHRAAVALDAARAEAELASRSKSEFLANMSHELRTPLNAVIGFAQLIGMSKDQPLSADQLVEYASYIEQSAQNLLELITSILELSAIQAGRMDLHVETVDLKAALEACLAVVKTKADDARLKWRIAIDPDLPAVHGDKAKLKQVFANILSNAVKFTPAGGAIRVAAEAHAQGVAVRIRDTGIGMSEEQAALALEPFRQAASSLSRDFDGAGLGLPIAKAIVDGHGGRLSLTSREGVGTEVSILLPLGAPPRSQAH